MPAPNVRARRAAIIAEMARARAAGERVDLDLILELHKLNNLR